MKSPSNPPFVKKKGGGTNSRLVMDSQVNLTPVPPRAHLSHTIRGVASVQYSRDDKHKGAENDKRHGAKD